MCVTMDADGFSIVDNRAGVTFGVELYVPRDAPEVVVDVSRSFPMFSEWLVVVTARQRVAFFRGETPVVFECLFRTVGVWTRTFMM